MIKMYIEKKIYHDLLKEVHPDLHPNLVDSVQKTQIVTKNKNNPLILKKLAIEWGYLIQKKIVYNSLNDFGLLPLTNYDKKKIYLKIKGNVQCIVKLLRTTKNGCIVDKYGYEVYVPINGIITCYKNFLTKH